MADTANPKGLPEEHLPAKVDKPWGGGLGRAEDLHNEYVQALEDWDTFQKQNGPKLAFWTAVNELLRKVRNGRGSSGLTAARILKHFGVDAAYDRIVQTANPSLSQAKKIAYEPDATIDKLLLLDQFPDRNSIPNVSESDIDNEFLEFGRELGRLRAGPERTAGELVNYMTTGDESGLAGGLKALFSGDDGHFKGLKETEDSYNPFYSAFFHLNYRQKVAAARELTTRLSETHVGKRFLASLFDLWNDAIFNPYHFVDPPILENRAKTERRDFGVHVQTQADYDRYFDQDGKVNVVGATNGYGGVAESLLELVNNLAPGVALHGEEEFHATGSFPDTKLAVFFGTAMTRYVGPDDVRAHDANLATALEEIQAGNRAWSRNDVETLGSTVLGATDQILETALPERPVSGKTTKTKVRRLSGGLKMLFGAWGVIELGISITQKIANGQSPTPGDVAKAFHSVLSTIADFDAVELFLSKEVGKNSRLVRFSKFVGRFNPLLIIWGIYMSGTDIVKEYEELDYDAAVAVGVMGVGGAMMGVAGYAAGGAVFSPAGLLVLFGATLFVGGYLVYQHVNDTHLETILKHSGFGVKWNKATSTSEPVNRGPYDQPDTLWFRFRYPNDHPESYLRGEPNYNRQLSALASLARPIGLDTLAHDEDEDVLDPDDTGATNDPERTVGKVKIDPLDAVGGSNADLDVYADGELYLVPLDVPYPKRDGHTVGPIQYKIPTGVVPFTYTFGQPPLHRIRLGDWYDESASPGSRYQMFHSEVPIADWYRSDVRLRPTHTPSTAAVAPGADIKIRTWDGRLFARTTPAVSHVLGFSTPDIEEDETWMEVVYAPPQVARTLRQLQQVKRDARIRRALEDWPMVSRERKKITDEV